MNERKGSNAIVFSEYPPLKWAYVGTNQIGKRGNKIYVYDIILIDNRCLIGTYVVYAYRASISIDIPLKR